jgi:hypothetical protein
LNTCCNNAPLLTADSAGITSVTLFMATLLELRTLLGVRHSELVRLLRDTARHRERLLEEAAIKLAVAIRSAASPAFHGISWDQIRLRLDGRDRKRDVRMFGCQSRTDGV